MVERFSGEWKTVNFDDVITPKARIGWQGLRKDEYLHSGYSYLISGTDFHDGTISLANIWQVSKARYDMDRNIQVTEGDVLVTKDGTIGKVAVVPKLSKPATLNSGVFVFRPHNGLIRPFLFRVLQSPAFIQFINTLAAGSTIKHLYQKNLRDFSFMLPPLEEQHAIADTLSAFDRHISALSALIAKKQAVRQGALEDLMTGRTRLDSFCDSWKTVKLGELCEITSSKRVFESEWQQSGIPFLRTRDIASFHAGEEQKDKLFISEATYREKVAVSGELRKGDLLVTGVGTIGLPFIVDTDAKMYFKDGNILWVKRSNKIDTKFLYYLFLSRDIITQIKTFSGFTTVGTLTIQNAKKLQVNLPPMDEQLAISSVLSALDSELSALNSERAKFSAIRQAAISDLLTGKIRLERTAH